MSKNEAVFERGLRCITWQDGLALLRMRRIGIREAAQLAAQTPGRYSLTLEPGGGLSLLLPVSELAQLLAVLTHCPAPQILTGLSAICAAGVCMSGAENKARCICAALTQADIPLFSLSLCDLAATISVRTSDRDRAVRLIETNVPLVK